MGFFFNLLRRLQPLRVEGSATPPSSVIHTTGHSQVSGVHGSAGTSPNGIRKDIIRVVLKQTLTHNGIPTSWVAVESLVAKSRDQTTGLHIRFSIRHWDPRLMRHAFDFQEDFNDRLQALDPEAENWLFGYSWQFKVPGLWPGGMPHPGFWTSETKQPEVRTARDKEAPTGGSADIISGPVVISRQPATSAADVRSDLEALMALRLSDSAQHQQTVHSFAPTVPSRLSNE